MAKVGVKGLSRVSQLRNTIS